MPRPRTTRWPTRDSLRKDLSRGKTLKEIATDYGHSVGWLNNVRRRYGLGPEPCGPLVLEGDLLALFLGSMLGDGSLGKKDNRMWFSEGHSVAQKGYVEWKRRRWGVWAGNLHRSAPRLTIDGDRVVRKREHWSFTTRSSPTFVPWEEAFYGWKRKGRRAKRFPEEVLGHATPLMIAAGACP